MQLNTIIHGNCLEVLKTLPDKSVQCCVTSPPYWGLRDYGTASWNGGDSNCDHKGEPMRTRAYVNQNCGTGDDVKNSQNHQPMKDTCTKCGAKRIDQQLGLEKTPEEYISKMVEIFREVKRVLRDDGTLWLNLGDSYAGSGRGLDADGSWNPGNGNSKQETHRHNKNQIGNSLHANQMEAGVIGNKWVKPPRGLKPKDLVGIPWMLAFALRADGWYLRQDIIWHKPNPMPESVTDRCTKSHEYIFLLSKSQRYYYDAFSIATPYADKTFTTFGCESKGRGDGSGMIQSENWGNTIAVRKPKVWKTPDGWDTEKGSHGTIHREGRSKGKIVKEKTAEGYGLNGNGFKGHSGNLDADGNLLGSGKANKRSVWTVATMPYKEAHFATFPEKLIIDCIKAGCPEEEVVLDPFMGAGTTALVARKLNRNFIGIELNQKYITIANRRLKKELGMFN